jgi:hypothetical protein
MHRCFLLSVILTLTVAPGHADSLIEFRIDKKEKRSIQPVIVKDNSLLIKGVGGNENLDILYQKTDERLLVINHGKQQITPITENGIENVANQSKLIAPLIRGITDRLKSLSPKQQANPKGIDRETSMSQSGSDSALQSEESSISVRAGGTKNIAGIDCKQINVRKRSKTVAELCLANPTALKLSDSDYGTIRSLLDFTQRLVKKANGLSNQFGFNLPASEIDNLRGIPLELKNFSGKRSVTSTLIRITKSDHLTDKLNAPGNYKIRELKLWN